MKLNLINSIFFILLLYVKHEDIYKEYCKTILYLQFKKLENAVCAWQYIFKDFGYCLYIK